MTAFAMDAIDGMSQAIGASSTTLNVNSADGTRHPAIAIGIIQ
jgi:hypothetical protein